MPRIVGIQIVGMLFRIPLLETPRPKGMHEEILCPICGKKWKPWAGSRLPCHSRCLFTEDAVKAIRASPKANSVIAKSLGVSYSVIQSIRSRS